ncbi:MAG: PQQ-binding-like beta-propeller repeat protein, partial [Herpetosiphonaceae bacterium]|nr:PQQ-binding-like beta-propeller repeat protein [Herpetosiphonaceae bacterium]
PSGPRSNCPLPASPDFDFGAGANLFQANINGHLQTVLGAGQKSGIYWAIDPDTGGVLWSTAVGPSGKIGGIQWGTATDGTRIYVAIANSHHDAYKLVPAGQTVTGGAWSALDPATGKLLWQTADPYNAVDVAAVTVANGVVYVAALDSVGHMYALDAATGAIRWTFASGGSVAAGPAISHGVVYWGSGYDRWGSTSSNTFYAFSIGAGSLAMSPASGSFQQVISLNGTQFGPSETVSIHNDAVSSPVLSTATTTPDGSFQASATVPEATFGVHTLFAVGQSSGISAATTYSVQPVFVLAPGTVSSGSTMTGSGFGFGSTEAVKLYWDTSARPLGTGHTSIQGTFKDAGAVVFTVPRGTGKGTHKIIAIGQTSRAQTIVPVVVQ